MLRRAPFVVCVLACLIWPAPARAQQQVFADCPPGAFSTFGSTSPDGRVLRGVHVDCGDTKLWADRVDLPADQPDVIIATGNVLLQQPDFTVTATRAIMNRRTKLGVFDQANGLARISSGPIARSQFGTMEPDLTFNVERLEKTGPRTYKLTNGTFTTCQQPTARWDLHGTSGTVTLDERVLLRNAVLRVKGVPLLYLPFIYYPINDEDRSTGFLIPKYQSSSIGGAGIGNAFFWAINRSQDATFYHDWFAKSGQRYGSEYRYIAAPGSEGNVLFTLFNEKPLLNSSGAEIRPGSRSIDLRGNLTQALPRGFRLTARSDYASDVTTRQLYNENIFDLTNRRRYFGTTLTGTFARYFRLSTTADRDDVFYGTRIVRRGSAPSAAVTFADTPIGRSRIYVGATTDVKYTIDQTIDETVAEDGAVTTSTIDRDYLKFNFSPAIRLPVSSLEYLRVTTSARWQFTRWAQSFDPEANAQVSVPVNRSMLFLQTNLSGPTFQRTWTREGGQYADRIRHQIEPTLSLGWTSKFDDFDRVPLGDYDRQVGGTTTVTYGLSNRIMARRPVEGGRGSYRDIVLVSLSQSYYTDPRAAIFDPQNQSSRSPGAYSPLRLNVAVTPIDRMTGAFSTEIDPKFRTPRIFSATGRYGSGTADVSAHWTKQQFIPGLPGFDDERYATHTLGASTRLRLLGNRVGGTYGFNIDIRNKRWVRQVISGYYNAQCCGLTFDYYVVDRGIPGFPDDKVFNFSFTLAGIGSFANPLGAFGNRQ